MSRIRKAADQMRECERVLGWMRDASWTGGIYVLVPATQYGEPGMVWAYVTKVNSGGASLSPIHGYFSSSTTMTAKRDGDRPVFSGRPEKRGQWAFWEVEGIRFLSDSYPELLELQPQFPRPIGLSPWGPTLVEAKINEYLKHKARKQVSK